jgi:vancomycin resistance protein YoaR
MRAEVDVRPVRERRRARPRRGLLRAVPWLEIGLWGGGLALFSALAAGVVFAGSGGRIAAGVTVDGVNVGGLTPEQASKRLAAQAARYASVPVTLTAGGERFRLRPVDLDARVDWLGAAEEAQAAGTWPKPFRGLKRIAVRLFGADLEPRADVYEPRLEYELERMAREINRPGRNAAIVLQGLEPTIVPDREGRTLDLPRAANVVRTAVAGFARHPFELPVRIGPPSVTAEELRPVVDQVRTALSAPVRYGWRDAHWLVEPKELAGLLALPANGRGELEIGGAKAKRYYALLARAVNRKPKDADFRVRPNGRVRVVASASGRKLDVVASGEALLAGALSREKREAELVVRMEEPSLTTERARAMKVTSVLASYSTAYSGSYDRIRNLQHAVSLLDGKRLAPGETFSFNDVVGPRTARRGFRVAPTIVEGEYKDAFGGGVSQVATTVFNAAWEAGLRIRDRSAHSLYISRYPLGRDATVNYPDVDLKFENDTNSWIVVKGDSGDTAITISLLGAPTGRRVVSEPGELEETAPPKVETVPDPTMLVGDSVVIDDGEPSRSVRVKRIVYRGDEVLYEETWYTSYDAEPKIVRVGTRPRPVEEEPDEPVAPAPPAAPAPPELTPQPPPPPPKSSGDKPGTTGSTATTPTTTGP